MSLLSPALTGGFFTTSATCEAQTSPGALPKVILEAGRVGRGWGFPLTLESQLPYPFFPIPLPQLTFLQNTFTVVILCGILPA